MIDRIAVQDTYPDDFSHCFGCGRHNESGYHLKTYREGDAARTDYTPADYHTGGGDHAYGGIIASVIDCHSAGVAAIFWMEANGIEVGATYSPRFVTARLEVDYVAPTPIGPLQLTGRVEEIGTRKVIVNTELSAAGSVTARGRAVMVKLPSG
jgi:acyl-coenzyme A thioesterase PaaI-like protein